MLTFLLQNARWIAGGLVLTYFSSFGQTFFISASISEWRAAFDLSHGEIGRLYMLATLVYTLSRLPHGDQAADGVQDHPTEDALGPVR